MCSGDEATKLKLAFSCFDKVKPARLQLHRPILPTAPPRAPSGAANAYPLPDLLMFCVHVAQDGDGHLTADEIRSLLRGSLEPAVSALHGAIDFASYSSDGVDVDAINDEAGGAATLCSSDDPALITVTLRTKVGTATLEVPRDALSPQALSEHGHHLSVDAFLGALVDDAMRKNDADANGSLEAEEFVAFAKDNPFLSIFFGHLTQSGVRAKSSWKDDFSSS